MVGLSKGMDRLDLISRRPMAVSAAAAVACAVILTAGCAGAVRGSAGAARGARAAHDVDRLLSSADDIPQGTSVRRPNTGGDGDLDRAQLRELSCKYSAAKLDAAAAVQEDKINEKRRSDPLLTREQAELSLLDSNSAFKNLQEKLSLLRAAYTRAKCGY